MAEMTTYQQYIHQSRYARWLPEKGRRETWPETVSRYCEFFANRFPDLADEIRGEIRESIERMDTMPSMRSLMTAGPALELENMAGYNCSYISVDNKRAFSEALYVLMCGTGVGFSCERQEIKKLPEIASEMRDCDDLIVVEDSRIGWAKAYQRLISHLYAGDIPKTDFSRIRPKGAPLKTFGGRASGPEPLERLFANTIRMFRNAAGRRFTSLEVHDLMCYIGEIVTVGGVRRSAMISLSNLSDARMRDAKSGQWWTTDPQRALANNSAVYTDRPEAEIFMEEWLALVKSKSGERGIFNREAAAKKFREIGRKEVEHIGTNPCCEILLRSRQLCNLTEVVVREGDDEASLMEKVRVATILGTLQASLTDFKFVSEAWEKNTREEALLGVSMTGIMDNPLTSGQNGEMHLSGMLLRLREYARAVNREYAERIGINPAAAITCVKPSGTVSQLVQSASGIHTRYAKHFLRTVRVDKKDPIYRFMVDKGVYHEDEVHRPDVGAVFYFPTRTPEHSITRNERDAIEQLGLWSVYQRYWCDHNPSVTIDVRDHEWPAVGAWVFDNFHLVCGVSFLPYSDHIYEQAPYQEITEEQYYDWVAKHPLPKIDWTELGRYESGDNTVSSQTMACVGGVCEIADSPAID
jgi:ribonucleoside-diphosphate reductase alpha chain